MGRAWEPFLITNDRNKKNPGKCALFVLYIYKYGHQVFLGEGGNDDFSLKKSV